MASFRYVTNEADKLEEQWTYSSKYMQQIHTHYISEDITTTNHKPTLVTLTTRRWCCFEVLYILLVRNQKPYTYPSRIHSWFTVGSTHSGPKQLTPRMFSE